MLTANQNTLLWNNKKNDDKWSIRFFKHKILNEGKKNIHTNFNATEIEARGHNYRVILKFCNSVTVFLIEALTMLITLDEWMLELWYFTGVSLVIRPFRGSHFFYPVTLALEIDPFFEHFYVAFNFLTGSTRALIFYISIPGEWIFPRVPLF